MRPGLSALAVLTALGLGAVSGCSAPSPAATVSVTTTATVTQTPETQSVGLALKPVDGTTRFGDELLLFLQSDIEGLEVDYTDDSDGCQVRIAVYGAQVTVGALDYDAYALPTEDCDTDGVATFRRIRGFAVVAEAIKCFGCGEGDVDDALYEQLVSPYGNREPVDFEFNGNGELVPVSQ
jgi:hypothetical protein